ncbi:MAG: nucleotide exchange factor GrpE [Candidatus Binatus sp.]|uniref:nucleotide exchange factor GrpE n=1 Tax=Candidatus Binatus sp. TaxID=2811406 RepID=UPI0027289EC5|nr:nucleotide exchange factor GrpE [Candidatus Binatus sp.]MDO8431550.1 nucleotide exchange factor GrpE [Candidatus Binatus sp.]
MGNRHKGNSGFGDDHDQADAARGTDAGGIEQPDASAATDAGGSNADLAALLAAKDKEIAELKDKYLRTLADSENARKRIRQQSEESVRIQRENILRDLLPVVDNLERAISAARGGTDIKTVVQGVEMVLAALHDFLRNQGVTPVSAVGEVFDPLRHEAADHVSSDQHQPNTVVSEFHRGYLLGDRILRPARVSVAKDGSARRSGGENDASDIENN